MKNPKEKIAMYLSVISLFFAVIALIINLLK